MPQVLLHYFSGTGNTKRAIDVITEHLKENGFEVKQLLIGTNRPSIPAKVDFQIFAFPVLSFAAPVFVKKYIRRLPRADNTKTAIFATYGGDPCQALQEMERILKRKKYDVFLTGGARYPDNWTQMMNPPLEREAMDIINRGDQMALEYAMSFIKKKPMLRQSNWLGNVITSIIAALFALIGRRFLGKTYITDSNCNKCGICVKTCPVNVIKMEGMIRQKPHWDFQCEDCGRCINICPQKAIQISIPRLFLHGIIQIILVTASFWAAGEMTHYFQADYRVLVWIITLILTIGITQVFQMTVIDRLFFLLEQIPGIGKFLAWNYTKNFRRYIAPGFKPILRDSETRKG